MAPRQLISKAEFARRLEAEKAAHNAGYDYYKGHAEELAVAVHREASKRYPIKSEVLAFMDGFMLRRLQHDEFKRESK